MSDFDINILINDQFNIQQKKLNVYNKILNKVYYKIKLINKRKKMDLIYEIPNYMFGYPLYNNRTCIVFVMSTLRTKGFYVKFNYPNILYISWKQLVNSNMKKVTEQLINKNNELINEKKNNLKINNHFKKVNKDLIEDINNLIEKEDDKVDYSEDLKKLNELSNLAKYYN